MSYAVFVKQKAAAVQKNSCVLQKMYYAKQSKNIVKATLFAYLRVKIPFSGQLKNKLRFKIILMLYKM